MSSEQPKITEGYMPFLGHQVYYRVVGENKDPKKKASFITSWRSRFYP